MRLIHHQETAVFFLHRHQSRNISNVAVHGIGAFGDDQHLAEFVSPGGQNPVQHFDVVMRKRPAGCTAQLTPLPDGVMRQGIINDKISFSAEIPDKGHVGRVTADQHKRVIASLPVRDFPLQLAIDGLFPGQQAAAAGRGSVLVDRRLGCLGNLLPAGHSNIIVAGKVELPDPVHHRSIRQSGIMSNKVGVTVMRRLDHFFPSGQEFNIFRGVFKSCNRLVLTHKELPPDSVVHWSDSCPHRMIIQEAPASGNRNTAEKQNSAIPVLSCSETVLRSASVTAVLPLLPGCTFIQIIVQ